MNIVDAVLVGFFIKRWNEKTYQPVDFNNAIFFQKIMKETSSLIDTNI